MNHRENNKSNSFNKAIAIFAALLAVGVFLYLSSIVFESPDYEKYYDEKDMKVFRQYVDDHVKDMLTNKDAFERFHSMFKLKMCGYNETVGAREIMLEVALPALLKALYEEEKASNRRMIIIVIGGLHIDGNTFIPILVDRIENDDECVLEACLGELSEYREEAKEYVSYYIEGLHSKNTMIKRSAIWGLKNFGRYAVSAIDELENIAKHDPDECFRAIAANTIKSIKEDLEKEKDAM